jgi:hypothetical protein
LVSIDTETAATSVIAVLSPTLGSVGGMAVVGDVGYFTSAGPGAFRPGSNALYAIDLVTGEHTLIGEFPDTISGTGISGLAVPEPATLALLTLGALALGRRRAR